MTVGAKRLFVVGGSGFVGSHLCQEAVQSGWKVTSLSRHGHPASLQSQPWSHKVDWITGDVNDPSQYVDQLRNCDAVVHSVGLLLENPNYQELALHPISFLSNYLSSYVSSANVQQKPKRTYEQVNRDTALILATAAADCPNVKCFSYISANHNIPPFLPNRYISSKIEAENALCSMSQFKTLVFRPGVMYSKDRPISLMGAGALTISRALPMIPNQFPWMAVQPLSVATVAKAILQAVKKSLNEASPTQGNEIYEADDMVQLSMQAN